MIRCEYGEIIAFQTVFNVDEWFNLAVWGYSNNACDGSILE
jgi:hypothetical protein